MKEDDPRVTDLRRYRKARERARRRPPPKPQPSGQGFLGPRKNAGLILALVLMVLVGLWLAQGFL